MSEIFEQFSSSVEKYLKDFRSYFSGIMKSESYFLDLILKYIHKKNGKQLRPLLVFLSADLTGDINENTFVAASMIELLHTATLVHDDVVDNSLLRRGIFSVKYLWKSKAAVLVGDYLLSKGLLLAVKSKAYEILEEVSNAVSLMSEGELIQLKRSRKFDYDYDTYFKVISMKTASLISTSLAVGAISANASAEKIDLLRKIGLNLGIAFQIRDDILDLQSDSFFGKPKYNDLREGKITLPMIYVLNNLNSQDKELIISVLAKKHKQNNDIKFLATKVVENGGIDFAQKEINKYLEESTNLLKSFDDSEAKDLFLLLTDYIGKRKI